MSDSAFVILTVDNVSENIENTVFFDMFSTHLKPKELIRVIKESDWIKMVDNYKI